MPDINWDRVLRGLAVFGGVVVAGAIFLRRKSRKRYVERHNVEVVHSSDYLPGTGYQGRKGADRMTPVTAREAFVSLNFTYDEEAQARLAQARKQVETIRAEEQQKPPAWRLPPDQLNRKIVDAVTTVQSVYYTHLAKEGTVLQGENGDRYRRRAVLQVALQEAGLKSHYERVMFFLRNAETNRWEPAGENAIIRVDVKEDGSYDYIIDQSRGQNGWRTDVTPRRKGEILFGMEGTPFAYLLNTEDRNVVWQPSPWARLADRLHIRRFIPLPPVSAQGPRDIVGDAIRIFWDLDADRGLRDVSPQKKRAIAWDIAYELQDSSKLAGGVGTTHIIRAAFKRNGVTAVPEALAVIEGLNPVGRSPRDRGAFEKLRAARERAGRVLFVEMALLADEMDKVRFALDMERRLRREAQQALADPTLRLTEEDRDKLRARMEVLKRSIPRWEARLEGLQKRITVGAYSDEDVRRVALSSKEFASILKRHGIEGLQAQEVTIHRRKGWEKEVLREIDARALHIRRQLSEIPAFAKDVPAEKAQQIARDLALEGGLVAGLPRVQRQALSTARVQEVFAKHGVGVEPARARVVTPEAHEDSAALRAERERFAELINRRPGSDRFSEERIAQAAAQKPVLWGTLPLDVQTAALVEHVKTGSSLEEILRRWTAAGAPATPAEKIIEFYDRFYEMNPQLDPAKKKDVIYNTISGLSYPDIYARTESGRVTKSLVDEINRRLKHDPERVRRIGEAMFTAMAELEISLPEGLTPEHQQYVRQRAIIALADQKFLRAMYERSFDTRDFVKCHLYLELTLPQQWWEQVAALDQALEKNGDAEEMEQLKSYRAEVAKRIARGPRQLTPELLEAMIKLERHPSFQELGAEDRAFAVRQFIDTLPDAPPAEGGSGLRPVDTDRRIVEILSLRQTAGFQRAAPGEQMPPPTILPDWISREELAEALQCRPDDVDAKVQSNEAFFRELMIRWQERPDLAASMRFADFARLVIWSDQEPRMRNAEAQRRFEREQGLDTPQDPLRAAQQNDPRRGWNVGMASSWNGGKRSVLEIMSELAGKGFFKK